MTDAPRLLPQRRTAAIILAGTTVSALLSFWYRYMDVLARSGNEPFQIRLIEEATGLFGAALLLVPVVWITRTIRWRKAGRVLELALHLVLLAAFAGLHTSLLWGSRSLLFPLAGLGPYDYGDMPIRYAMELGIQVPIYLLAVGGALVFEHLRQSRSRDLVVVRLEGELARARLSNLEHRLRPHFLFNTLNTISSIMYEDLDRADRMLSDLSHFLRGSLRALDGQEVSVQEELDNLERYLDIARARFQDRLEARVEVDAEVRDAAVPILVLQPLVENALQHGDPGEDRLACVRVRVFKREGRLLVEVADNGPGADAPLEILATKGIGLGTTLRRLQLLYPDSHRASGKNLPEGGYRVRIELPLVRLEASPPDGAV